MDDSRLDDNRLRAQREPHVVQRVEVQRESRFHGEALHAQLRDGHWFEHHDFANELAQHRNALVLTLLRHGLRHFIVASRLQAEATVQPPYTRWGGPKAAPEIASSTRASCAISIHPQRGTRGKRLLFFVRQLRERSVEILSFVLGGAWEHGDVARLLIELQ